MTCYDNNNYIITCYDNYNTLTLERWVWNRYYIYIVQTCHTKKLKNYCEPVSFKKNTELQLCMLSNIVWFWVGSLYYDPYLAV